jgi:hypothetical protein
MALIRKIPSVPFIGAGGFLFLLGLLCGAFSANAGDSLLPPDTVLQQVAVWKNFRVKLMSSAPRAEIKAPVEVFIEAKREEMGTPFSGSLSLGFEKVSPEGGALQETELKPSDQEEPGLWRATHVFQEPGVYAIRAILTEEGGEIFVLQGKISIHSGPSASTKNSLCLGRTSSRRGLRLCLKTGPGRS